MTDHASGTCAEWLAARLELLEAEKLTRRSDQLAGRLIAAFRVSLDGFTSARTAKLLRQTEASCCDKQKGDRK